MAKALLFKPFPIFIHVSGWMVYILWVGAVNVFKYGWGHTWVMIGIIPIMVGIFYLNWYGLRRLFMKGWNWKGLMFSVLYLSVLLFFGYQVLYGYPNQFARRVLKFPDQPMAGFAIYFIEISGFYWAFAFKGLGLAGGEILFNLLQIRFAYIMGKRRDLSEQRKRIHMRRWISHFLGNLTQSVAYTIKKGRISVVLLESYGIIWAFGVRIMARENNFFIPLDLELYHLQRLTNIYPIDALQVMVSGNTHGVQIVPMVLLNLYKNIYKHGDLQAKSETLFQVDCRTDRLIVTTKNDIAARSRWVYENGGTGLTQLENILKEQYAEAAHIQYKTDNNTFLLQIEISLTDGRVQNNFESSG